MDLRDTRALRTEAGTAKRVGCRDAGDHEQDGIQGDRDPPPDLLPERKAHQGERHQHPHAASRTGTRHERGDHPPRYGDTEAAQLQRRAHLALSSRQQIPGAGRRVWPLHHRRDRRRGSCQRVYFQRPAFPRDVPGACAETGAARPQPRLRALLECGQRERRRSPDHRGGEGGQAPRPHALLHVRRQCLCPSCRGHHRPALSHALRAGDEHGNGARRARPTSVVHGRIPVSSG